MRLKIPPKYLILIGAILLLNAVFPPPPVGTKRYEVAQGEIARQDIIAPYDFFIPKTEDELYEERMEITKRIPPVYILDRSVQGSVREELATLNMYLDSLEKTAKLPRDSIIGIVQRTYAIEYSTLSYLLKTNRNRLFRDIGAELDEFYSGGVIDVKKPQYRIITIIDNDKEIVESAEILYSIAQAESIIVKNHRDETARLMRFFLKPNIVYNEKRTNGRVEEVFANIPKTKGKVLKGELIVEKHKRITESAMEKISALETTYISIGTWEIVKTVLFRNLIFLSLMYLVFRLSIVSGVHFFEKKNLYFIALLTGAYLVVGYLVNITNVIYLLPISFFIFLFALYFNMYIALVFSIIFAALFGITYNSMPVLLFLLVSGIVSAFSTQTINTRHSVYRPMIYIALANVVAIVFIDMYLLNGRIQLVHIGEGVLNSILGGVLFVLFLPIFERLFDFTTDLTLLELGNLNLPLFKEMALEAPGSYHHSIVVGSLAEAAARVIDADPILARVGAYYHDIGKLKKPEYFIENQIGVKNPHDNLKPQMSALIIISHVKDGVDMAKKMKLPKTLVSIIEQHHGTTAVELFYKKAMGNGEDVQEDTFRYPGPKPKNKEAALIMLADTVEAAARSEKNITVTKLQKILKESVLKKFNDGQLDDCPVHRQDLENIKTAFLSILTGVFHPRIEYDIKNNIPGSPKEVKKNRE
ncbi:MAG: HDIG domain-containing protein [candidate division WOR-3 bacterium]|nr:MAG: HDIG domain-containing protein [candidate division WOR-3 bacterium]